MAKVDTHIVVIGITAITVANYYGFKEIAGYTALLTFLGLSIYHV